jgi:hypothetical protein
MNQDNVSEWIDVLFQKARTINNQLIVLVYVTNKIDRHDITEMLMEVALNTT